ncbi:MAG: DUF4292 domain-containing protein [Bacteroidetes bacterium]|jgi:hypothetical protein|nr:DUF4292 domain-containing protein [Bacteroidota bacterium]
MIKKNHISIFYLCLIGTLLVMLSCKSKKHVQQTAIQTQTEDTTGRCRLQFKSAKSLSKHIKESELKYDWLYAKADVETLIDGEDHNLDVRIKARKDSAIWISIQAVGLIDIAKLLITRDSVKMVVYVKKQYFKGDFNYINQLLNADLDFDLIQAALIGNSADFDDDDTKMKPVIDRENCQYLLSTVRKRKLRRINSGQDSLKRSLQIMRLNPDNFKIINNDFEDVSTNRSFHAKYEKFLASDSVFAPHNVNIEIKAEKKIDLKINYVRIEINQPQKLTLNIPKSYEPIPIKKEQR